MAGSYNDSVARTVTQGYVTVQATAWTPLVASGTNGSTSGCTPLGGRRQLRYQIKTSAKGGAMAIAYSPKNANGTFTAPTTGVSLCTVVGGNSTVVEPIGDAVQVWGRLTPKAGFSSAHIRVIVTEYA